MLASIVITLDQSLISMVASTRATSKGWRRSHSGSGRGHGYLDSNSRGLWSDRCILMSLNPSSASKCQNLL